MVTYLVEFFECLVCSRKHQVKMKKGWKELKNKWGVDDHGQSNQGQSN